MREIKFRQPIFENGKFSKFHYWGFIRKGEFTGVVPPLREAEEQSQQFTGLRDRRNVPIYESDVVCLELCSKDDPAYGFYGEKYIVSLKDGCFGWEEDGSYFCLRQIHSVIEVIGNIYENPELLK